MQVLGMLLTFCWPKMLSWAMNVSYIPGVLRDPSGYLWLEDGSYFIGQTSVCEEKVFVETENTKHISMLEDVGKECIRNEVVFTIYVTSHDGRCLSCDGVPYTLCGFSLFFLPILLTAPPSPPPSPPFPPPSPPPFLPPFTLCRRAHMYRSYPCVLFLCSYCPSFSSSPSSSFSSPPLLTLCVGDTNI